MSGSPYFDVADPAVLRQILRRGCLLLTVCATLAAVIAAIAFGSSGVVPVALALALVFWLSLRVAAVVAWESSFKARSSFTIAASPRQVFLASLGVAVPLLAFHLVGIWLTTASIGTPATTSLLIWAAPIYIVAVVVTMCAIYLPLLLFIRVFVRDTPLTNRVLAAVRQHGG